MIQLFVIIWFGLGVLSIPLSFRRCVKYHTKNFPHMARIPGRSRSFALQQAVVLAFAGALALPIVFLLTKEKTN